MYFETDGRYRIRAQLVAPGELEVDLEVIGKSDALVPRRRRVRYAEDLETLQADLGRDVAAHLREELRHAFTRYGGNFHLPPRPVAPADLVRRLQVLEDTVTHLVLLKPAAPAPVLRLSNPTNPTGPCCDGNDYRGHEVGCRRKP